MRELYDNPGFIDGGEHVRAYGKPSTMQFNNVKMPTAPLTDPVRAALQFALLGGVGGLGYTGVKTLATGKKPGGWRTVRNIGVGSALGTLFGVLAARENRKRFGGPPVTSYADLLGKMHTRLNSKVAMEKDAVLPLLAVLPAVGTALGTALTAASVYGAGKSGVKGIGAAAKGNWRAAGGHAAGALGNLLMAIPFAGNIAKGTKMLRHASRAHKFLRPAARAATVTTKALSKPLHAAHKINGVMWGTNRVIPTKVPKNFVGPTRKFMQVNDPWYKNVARMAGFGALSSVPDSVSARMLAAPGSAGKAQQATQVARSANQPGLGASLLRMIPSPTAPQFRAAV